MLNYTGPDCELYGGDTVEQAARNVSNGRWLRADKNCAYYVIVGNNMRFPTDEAVFYFSRSGSAWLQSMLALAVVLMITLI